MTRLLFTSFLTLLLSGCMVEQSARTVEAEAASADRISHLIEDARAAMEASRLTTPRENNAFDKFRQILKIDPTNEIALQGINTIVETYLSWAIEHARDGNIGQARYYLGRAETVDATHPNIQPVITLIRDSEQSEREVYALTRTTVSDRTRRDPVFEQVAANLVEGHSFVIIRAPDDESGRWIYQQLNDRVSFRVEARFEASNRSSIELTRRND